MSTESLAPILCFAYLANIAMSCNTVTVSGTADIAFTRALQERLILADSGSIIDIAAGTWYPDRTLSLDGIDYVTIRGEGSGKSILDFSHQTEGAEGMLIKANHVVMEGMTIQNTAGDALKVQDSRYVAMRDVHTTWTGGAQSTNGGYGLYPVSCSHVLIERCEASFASDAGIYVGQSAYVIVRHSRAHHNVAGIEIENSSYVEVYGNTAENNSGGILIFDMPALPKANGRQVKVFGNTVHDNNHHNFAPEGGVVATLPPGTGMLVLAHEQVAIYENTITDYKTMGLGITSWLFTEQPFDTLNGFVPYYDRIYVHDNVFERKKAIPDVTKPMGRMLNALFPGRPQDIMIDGIFGSTDTRICLQRNGQDLRFVNLRASTATGLSDLRNSLDHDMGPFDCPALGFEYPEEAKLFFAAHEQIK